MKTTINKPFKLGSHENYILAIQQLHNDLEQVSKNISYLDVYNIVDVVENKNNFGGQIASLVNNSSLVINTTPFDYLGESYNTGDIVLKNATGKIIHIKTQAGGLFFPVQLNAIGTNYNLIYEYSPVAPTSEYEYSGEEDIPEKYSEPYQTMKFKLPSTEAPSSIFGIWDKMNINESSTTYTFQKNGNIEPQIQFWLCDDKNQPIDQLYVDYSLTEEGNNFKIEIKYKIEDLYVKVK